MWLLRGLDRRFLTNPCQVSPLINDLIIGAIKPSGLTKRTLTMTDRPQSQSVVNNKLQRLVVLLQVSMLLIDIAAYLQPPLIIKCNTVLTAFI